LIACRSSIGSCCVSLTSAGGSLAQKSGYAGSFFTGVLAMVVATPCTAPFMGAAIGYALSHSVIVSFTVFTALALGLALPYLALAYFPGWARILPKPGAWMDTLKQVFAFPMYASAAWLLWVLAQQTSSIGLGAALAGAILVGLAAWAYQKSKGISVGGRVAALATALAAVLAAIVLPVRFADVAAASPAPQSSASGEASEQWQPYDAARVAELRAQGAPLLVNFTASWCLSCQVNERVALEQPSVQKAFQDSNVALLKADWTRGDDAITQTLAALGRSGVPAYALYVPGESSPRLLPEALTPGIVIEAVSKLPKPATQSLASTSNLK